jgi:hypothetical protein
METFITTPDHASTAAPTNGASLCRPIGASGQTSRPSAAPITILVRSAKSSGYFEARVQGAELLLVTSRQPLLDAARALLAVGCDPEVVLEIRRPGATSWDLRAILRVAARLTVDEHNGTRFAKWTPLPRSMGPRRMASRRRRTTDTREGYSELVRGPSRTQAEP